MSVPELQHDRDARQRRLPLQIKAQRGTEPDLVEQRRPQVDGDLPDPRDQLIDERQRLRRRLVRRGDRRSAVELQPQLERGQRLAELVVQLVREEAALLFLGRLQAAVKQAEALVGDAQLAEHAPRGGGVGLDVADDEVDHRRQQHRQQRRGGRHPDPVPEQQRIDLAGGEMEDLVRDQEADDQVGQRGEADHDEAEVAAEDDDAQHAGGDDDDAQPGGKAGAPEEEDSRWRTGRGWRPAPGAARAVRAARATTGAARRLLPSRRCPLRRGGSLRRRSPAPPAAAPPRLSR